MTNAIRIAAMLPLRFGEQVACYTTTLIVPSGGTPIAHIAHNEHFEWNGATLVDEILGGPADRHMVFLHGWGATRDSLRGVAVLFQQTHCVHLIDLPGFGDAPLPPAGWSTIDYANLVEQYLVDRVHGALTLVGHSFGARVALRLAARRALQVRALVLMAAPGLPPSPFSRVAVRRVGIRALRRLLQTASAVTGPGALDWHTRRFASKDYLAAGPLKDVLVRAVNEDLTPFAQAVACPALLLWGAGGPGHAAQARVSLS